MFGIEATFTEYVYKFPYDDNFKAMFTCIFYY